MTVLREDLLRQLAARTQDPELEERRQHILAVFLEERPEERQRILDEGFAQGIERGIVETSLLLLTQLAGVRLARQLSPAEQAFLVKRIQIHGAPHVTEVLAQLSPDALAKWLGETAVG